ncbi:742_t:CDS:2, partial [Acaulospora colombiana]
YSIGRAQNLTFSPLRYFGQVLVQQVQGGAVSQSRIDDLATRILAAWYYLGQDSGYPSVNFDSWSSSNSGNQHVNVQSDHKNIIRTVAAASTVLLKNKNNVLPLKKPTSLAVIVFPQAAIPSPTLQESTAVQIGTAILGHLLKAASTDGTSVTSSTSDTDTNAAANAARGKTAAIVVVT